MKRLSTKLIVFVLVALTIGTFFFFDFHNFLTLERLNAEYRNLYLLYLNNTALFVIMFIIGYILLTALYLPGPALLTLAAGGLFGFWKGLVVVSLASTLGATLAFLLARYFMKDFIEAKFSRAIAKVNEGLKQDDWLYLLMLRLLPGLPFFLVNLVTGVTKVKKTTFFLTTIVGMLPGHIIFLYAGRSLRHIRNLEDILSRETITALVVIGLVPLALKFALAKMRRSPFLGLRTGPF